MFFWLQSPHQEGPLGSAKANIVQKHEKHSEWRIQKENSQRLLTFPKVFLFVGSAPAASKILMTSTCSPLAAW